MVIASGWAITTTYLNYYINGFKKNILKKNFKKDIQAIKYIAGVIYLLDGSTITRLDNQAEYDRLIKLYK